MVVRRGDMVQGSDSPKILVEVHAGVSAAIHPRCVGVCSTSLHKNPEGNVRSISKINLLLTRAIESIICFLNSKMELQGTKQLRHLSSKALWWSWEWSPSLFPAVQGTVFRLGFQVETFPVPCICSPQSEKEQSGDGKVSLL